MNKDRINAFYDGVRHGVTSYAWWKDGVLYVGSGMLTQKEALNGVERRRQEELDYLELKENEKRTSVSDSGR